jgi:hypothetical protein
VLLPVFSRQCATVRNGELKFTAGTLKAYATVVTDFRRYRWAEGP